MAVRRGNMSHEARLAQFLRLVQDEPFSTTTELSIEAGLGASATRLYLMQLWREDKVNFQRDVNGSNAFCWTAR